MKLYDIPKEIEEFERELLDADGIVTPELEEQWKAFVSGGKLKIEAAAMVIKTLEASAKACAAEAKRLADRAKSQNGNVEQLKNLTIFAVDAFGGAKSPDCGKIKTPLFTIWTQNSAPVQDVTLNPETTLEQLEEIRPDFVRTVRELNRKAILEELKDGLELPECLDITEMPGTHFLRIL